MPETCRRPAPPQDRPSEHHTNAAQSTANNDDFDFDRRVVGQVDWSIWRAIYNGEFRLACRCRRCGRWLTDGTSKRRHFGPTCAAKAVTE
jgi:hypothetical protein